MNIFTVARDAAIYWYSLFMYTEPTMDARSTYPTETTEPAFTSVLLGIVADYVENHRIGDTPTITRMEDNRFLWQTGKLTMSITINDVSQEYL